MSLFIAEKSLFQWFMQTFAGEGGGKKWSYMWKFICGNDSIHGNEINWQFFLNFRVWKNVLPWRKKAKDIAENWISQFMPDITPEKWFHFLFFGLKNLEDYLLTTQVPYLIFCIEQSFHGAWTQELNTHHSAHF